MRPLADALNPDPRFATMVVVNDDGSARALEFGDHYRVVAGLNTIRAAPTEVLNAYQRALSCLLYAWFDYELMIVAEVQALASFELAIKLRLNRPADAPPLLGMAAKLRAAFDAGLLARPDPGDTPDEYFLLRTLRNDLAHGTADVHPPALAIEVIRRCAEMIARLYPA